MMRDAILDFAKQFSYEPVIENAEKLGSYKNYLLNGMGGSHLAADLLLRVAPLFPMTIRRDYGLGPQGKTATDETLFIASSYSGNTEEVVFAYDEAKQLGLNLAVIAVGGKLIERAKADGIPYIQLPNTGIQPRSALAFSFLALLKLLGQEELFEQTAALANSVQPETIEAQGKKLANSLKDQVPVVYCSQDNETVAWNWKIKLNETGKIPAFYNVFPELNHNEMTGFDAKETSQHLSKPFHFLLLTDETDHPKVQKRMDVVEKLYQDRGLAVTRLPMEGATTLEKIFRSLLLADWTAVYCAELYGLESEQVPMVEEFKNMIA